MAEQSVSTPNDPPRIDGGDQQAVAFEGAGAGNVTGAGSPASTQWFFFLF